jgi:hypothetical protein
MRRRMMRELIMITLIVIFLLVAIGASWLLYLRIRIAWREVKGKPMTMEEYVERYPHLPAEFYARAAAYLIAEFSVEEKQK